ncbi:MULTISPECIES: hybrid sensor histidine kinase/response regulator [Azospirillum]|nr:MULTISPECIES: ATP-binding protein [Azospirillum]MDW7552649.1 ATP-binding protein [Azospirillum brasilense]MDW7592159.1 ATP-binding protein [Azospirillum brasilense]MDW7627290.1 ATP-binding protein [Azospirillum brasilense]MDX5955021.1 ATP-binding protein [Azospirillum brasilense]TVZ50234.1 PAS domain S-box-containing protein [Azospirillum brasilense]
MAGGFAMNMISSELLLGLAQNIGLFAVVAVVFLQIRSRAAGWPTPVANTLLGLMFGGVAVLGMADPVRVAPGLFIDARNVMVGLAGPFGGALAGAAAAAVSGAFRFWLGGPGALAGVTSLVGAGLIGMLVGAAARRSGRFGNRHLAALALLVTVMAPFSFLLLPPDMAYRMFETTLVPLSLGNFLGTLALGTFLRKEQERCDLQIALTESQRRFAATVANLPGGVYQRVLTVDGRLRFPYCSPGFFQVMGLPPTERVTLEALNRILHPEDRPRLFASIHASAETLEPWRLEYRIIWSDGDVRWISVSSRAARRDNGDIVWDGIVTDVTETKRNEQALIQARLEAEAASRAKAEFLATMSHEMRTPLNGILGFARLLLDEDLTPRQNHHARLVRDAGRSLLTVIEDVLDFSRIEAGRLALNHTSFAIRDLIANCAAVLRLEAEAKGLTLHAAVAPDVPDWLRGDPDRLRQVVLNLLANAVKFTEHGDVGVTVVKTADTPAGPHLTISVADTGIGIPQDRQGQLFQRFSQIDRSRGGTGLGLAISRRLVEMMGGTVGVQSQASVGSTFWLSLVLPEADPPAGSGAPCAAELLVHRRPARILLAEDLAMNRELTVAMLRGAGHRVDTVADGRQAVAAVQRETYDLVLMDVHMPEMDGHAATREIRGLPTPVGSIPILAMSASALPEEVQRCRDAGMNGHIAKPVDRAAMLDAIDEAVGWSVQGGRAAEHPDGAARRGAMFETFAAVEPIPLRQPLDRAMLTRLSDELGEEACARLAAAFLDELPQRTSRLRKGSESGCPLAEAQALTAPAANLGLVRLASACRALSAALRAGRRHEAEGLVGSVLDAAEEGADALRDALLPGPGSSRFKSLAKDIVRTP